MPRSPRAKRRIPMRAEVRRILREIRANIRDGTRFVIVSPHAPPLGSAYYNLTDDMFVRRPAGATLFMRRDVALSVLAALGNPNARLALCRTRLRGGVLVALNSSLRHLTP